jgi:hypothetical protein
MGPGFRPGAYLTLLALTYFYRFGRSSG